MEMELNKGFAARIRAQICLSFWSLAQTFLWLPIVQRIVQVGWRRMHLIIKGWRSVRLSQRSLAQTLTGLSHPLTGFTAPPAGPL